MKAVVLVGGEGTRLRPLTSTTPKPLLPLMGRPFLHHVLDHLALHGVHEVVLSSPYLESVFSAFIDERRGDPAITWITESSPLGTGGAVVQALDALGDGTFFVLNGDILTDLDLTAMLRAHTERGASASIATMAVQDARPFGLIESDTDGRILAFKEKPTELVPGTINAGTYLLEPNGLATFPRGENLSIERVIFPEMIARGDRLLAYLTDSYWMDLGTPEKYLQAHFDILEGKFREERYPAPYLLDPDGIDLQAALGRWVVASEGVRVAAGARVEDSILMTGVHVAEGAAVTNSILAPGVRVGAGASLDAVVAGAGATIAEGAEMTGERVPAAAEDPA